MRKSSQLVVLAVVVCLVALATAPVAAESVTSEQVMRVYFTVDNNFTPEDPDVLRFNMGLIDVIAAFGDRNARLLDCSEELGFASTNSFGNYVGPLNLDPSNSFKTAGSLWNFDNPGVADFTPILDGSIEGRIDFTLTTGEVDIPLSQVNLDFVKATSGSGGIGISPDPTVTKVEVVASLQDPDPGMAGMTNTLSVTGAVPGNTVLFVLGINCAPQMIAACNDAIIDIGNFIFAGSAVAAADGTASLDVSVPNAASGLTVIFQALERESCKSTNTVSYAFP